MFLKLTHKGQLEGLIQKVSVERSEEWDGKWRLVIFDIPESSKEKRSLFRTLLKKNQFVKLQAGVYISPYSFCREAVIYLKESKLINFV